MPEKVVDLLEVVEVEEQNADALGAPHPQRVLDTVAEERSFASVVSESWNAE